jgi:hypothetical protein
MDIIKKNDDQSVDKPGSIQDLFKNKLAPILIEKSTVIKNILKEKVGTSTLKTIKDDDVMKDIFEKIYETLPLPIRLVIRREAFVKYCIDNRGMLIDLLEKII